jgi:hypothetical protein
MGQDAWSRNITARVAGRQVDMHAQAFADVITRRNNSSVAIFPGRFVVRDTSDVFCKIQDSGAVLAAGEFYHGLAVDNENRERVGSTLATAGYIEDALVPIARSGRWYAESEEAVNEGAQVFVRYVAGAGGSIIGKVRGDVDTASAEAVKAKFAETIAAAGLVAIDLNIAQV